MKNFLLIILLPILGACTTLGLSKPTPEETQRETFRNRYQEQTGRKLAVFMDGTGNTKESNTNIYRMFDFSVKKAESGTAIIPLYIKGVGTDWYNQISGGAMGRGLSKNIRQAYRFLVENYKPNDEIFIFGFSRGAYSARSLNGLIEFGNLLDRNKIEPGDIEAEVERLFAVYNSLNDGKVGFENRLRAKIKKEFKRKTLVKKVVVTAIGVFDTVPALGLKRDDFPDDHRTDLYANEGFHALSLDEQRYDFRLLQFDPNKLSSGQSFTEVWFAGAHADVGGGYNDLNGLENIALNWMLNAFAKFNIFVTDSVTTDCTRPATCEYGRLHDEFLDSKFFGKQGISRRRPQRGDLIHGSVVCRMNRTKPLDNPHAGREALGRYAPFNLKGPIGDNYDVIPYVCN